MARPRTDRQTMARVMMGELSGKGAENPATGERRRQEQIVTRAPCTQTVSFREQAWGSETGHELRGSVG